MNVAVKWQLIAVNPAKLVDAPKAADHEFVPLSAAQAREPIRVAEDDRMAARWLVGLALGLRQGEALGLWWEDVDLPARVLHVRRGLQRQPAAVWSSQLPKLPVHGGRSRYRFSLCTTCAIRRPVSWSPKACRPAW